MAKIDRFQDLTCWQKARELENKVYQLTLSGDFAKDFGLKDQINRSTGSIMDNIAEGFGRGGNKELINFLLISRASAFEVKSQLYRAHDRKHLSYQFSATFDKANEVISSISAFIVYLRNSERKGHRYE